MMDLEYRCYYCGNRYFTGSGLAAHFTNCRHRHRLPDPFVCVTQSAIDSARRKLVTIAKELAA